MKKIKNPISNLPNGSNGKQEAIKHRHRKDIIITTADKDGVVANGHAKLHRRT